MAVFYKLYQNNREGSATKGKWYARAVHTGTVTIDDLADEMQANCTVKRADIVAVLSELVETMTTHLQMSHRVKLDRLGSFKMGISTTGADDTEDYKPSSYLKNIHVVFQPETKVNEDKTRVKSLINGCTLKRWPNSTVSNALE